MMHTFRESVHNPKYDFSTLTDYGQALFWGGTGNLIPQNLPNHHYPPVSTIKLIHNNRQTI